MSVSVFSALEPLGATPLIHPIAIPADIGLIDWAVLIGSAVLLMIFALTGKRLTRLEGAVLLVLYVAYVGSLLGT